MKELVCIVCPNGCTLHIDTDGDGFCISGHKCKKGLLFAQSEMQDPLRTVCTTVRTVFPEAPVLSVRTDKEIPKSKIFEIMQHLNGFLLTERIGIGETVISNICGTDADIIATDNILKE